MRSRFCFNDDAIQPLPISLHPFKDINLCRVSIGILRVSHVHDDTRGGIIRAAGYFNDATISV